MAINCTQILAFVVLSIVLVAVAGCSGLKIDSDCSYVREVKTSYQCRNDGKLEHYRVEPKQ